MPALESSSEYLTAQQAAEFLKISASTLAKLRCYGGGPAFTRLGLRRVVYQRKHLDEWAAGGVRRHTSEGAGR